MTRNGRWAVALVTTWLLLLLAAAVWSAHNDPATVRGQTDLAQGRQTVDEAVAAMVAAAGPAAEVTVQPYDLATGCRVTLVRRGTELDQTVVMTVPAGQEQVMLDRLLAELPEPWGARYNPNTNRFFADAGEFVAVRGEVAEPGELRLTASTGCRPGSDPQLTGASTGQ